MTRIRSQPFACSAVQTLGDRRLAVAHRPVDLDPRPQIGERHGELLALRPGDRLQRPLVALVVPDRRVVASPGRRAPQQDELEDRRPDGARRLDHPLVRQELLQVAPHGPVVRALGRAEIDDQHADPAGADGRMVRRATRGASARRAAGSWLPRRGASPRSATDTRRDCRRPLAGAVIAFHAPAGERRGRRRRRRRHPSAGVKLVATPLMQ